MAAPSRLAAALLACGLLGTLAGCGFHLRTAVPLPPQMETTLVQGTAPLGELGRAIQRALDGAGSKITSSRDDATAVLVIQRDEVQRRVLSVDSSGKVNQYELTYYLRFALQARDGAVLLPAQSISLQRSYTFDPNNVLSKGNEETELRQDMIRFAVRQMMRRIEIGLQRRTPQQ